MDSMLSSQLLKSVLIYNFIFRNYCYQTVQLFNILINKDFINNANSLVNIK